MFGTIPLPLLDKSLHSFAPSAFGSIEVLKRQFGRRDGPVAVMVCCTDIGDAPEYVSRTRPGDLFVLQNSGNVVPKDNCGGSTANAIEFAIRKLFLRDVIICGHLNCPVVLESILDPTEQETPMQPSWLDYGERTRALMEEHYADLPSEFQGNIAVQENVLVQFENLIAHRFIKQRIQQRTLRLHGWILDDHTRRVWHYDPQSGQFDEP